MKASYFFIVMTVCYCLLWSEGKAQLNQKIDCDDKCVSQSYPYKFCIPGVGVVTKCSNNPNNQVDDDGNKMLPLKKSLPLPEICYDSASINPQFRIVRKSDSVSVIFHYADVDTIIKQARNAWMANICPMPQTEHIEGSNCDCIKVRWSDDPRDFIRAAGHPDSVHKVLALTRQDVYSDQDCLFDCETAVISLNKTPRFLGTDTIPDRFRPGKYFYTYGSNSEDYYPLYTVVLHEIGHWLGFGHTNLPDDYGADCFQGQSVMRAATLHEKKDLTEFDTCMFRKLYCCEETATGIEKEELNLLQEINVYPNPALSVVYLRLAEDLSQYNKILTLTNVEGKVILTKNMPSGSSLYTIELPDISNGMYFLKITLAERKNTISAKIVINK